MSNVKMKDIDFNHRYEKVVLFSEYDDVHEIVENLEKLYDFINTKENGKTDHKYGAAYRKILKQARIYASRRSRLISKRQVVNLINVYYDASDDNYFVKIPYTANYIFKAIFRILDDYREENNDIPEIMASCIGKFRRECFYEEQCYSYNHVCVDKQYTGLKMELNKDLNSDRCVLAKKVK